MIQKREAESDILTYNTSTDSNTDAEAPQSFSKWKGGKASVISLCFVFSKQKFHLARMILIINYYKYRVENQSQESKLFEILKQIGIFQPNKLF